MTLPFDYAGPPQLGERVASALAAVIDPEMALGILGLGLVYGVSADDDAVRVRMTMTSAACPVIEHIVADVEEALHPIAGDGRAVEVDVVWEPPWDPSRMSPSARYAMGWE